MCEGLSLGFLSCSIDLCSCFGHAGSLLAACGIYFPDQGLNPGPLHWEHRVLTTGLPGKSQGALTFFFLIIYLFVYFWLRWVFIAVHGLSLVAESRGYSSLWWAGLSLQWLLLLWSMGSRHTGSVVVAHRLSCSMACGIFLDQGLNPFPLHWQADS